MHDGTPQADRDPRARSDGDLCLAADRAASRLKTRRLAFLALVGVTCLAMVAALARVLAAGGLSVVELAMLGLFALNLPWLAIGWWNALIGFVLLRLRSDGLARAFPLSASPLPRTSRLRARLAITVPVRDEDPSAVFAALKATVRSLDETGHGAGIDIFLLSDSRNDLIAAHERELAEAWRRADPYPGRLHYRRRSTNRGFKAGNIADFCARWGRDYDLMLVLDADSVMSGEAIIDAVRLMEANPRLGILQTLVVGWPSLSPFARIFQFGMRHGMRSYTMGSAWWQGDAGPYWGHNAIVRLRPFVTHCRLPKVPGPPPLGGDVLSHDQIEAVLMRKAGWDVRVAPVETGSFEANPPTVLDFIKRDLRWCRGNMQYLRLLGLTGRHHLGRVQMALAILMYTGAPCWIAFCLLGIVQAAASSLGVEVPQVLADPGGPGAPAPVTLGIAMLAATLAMSWAPRLFGLLQVMTDRAARRAYGGGPRVLAGAGLEVAFSLMLAPVSAMAQTIFMGGLAFGRRLGWASQRRSERRVRLAEATRALWPQTLAGVLFLAAMWAFFPAGLPWAAPTLTGLLLAVPFAMLSSSPRVGRVLARARLCATPEELAPPAEIAAVCPWLAGPAPARRATDDDDREAEDNVPPPRAMAAGGGGRGAE